MATNTTAINGGNTSSIGLSGLQNGEPALFQNAIGTLFTALDGTSAQRLIYNKKSKNVSSYTDSEIASAGTFDAGTLAYRSDKGTVDLYNGSAWTNALSILTIITSAGSTISSNARNVIITSTAEAASFITYLQSAATVPNKVMRIKLNKTLTRTYYGTTITPLAGTINGAASYVLAGVGDYIEIIASGSDWIIIDKPTGYLKLASVTTPGMTSASQCNIDYVFSTKYSKYFITVKNTVGTNSGSYTNAIKFRVNAANDSETNQYINGGRWVGNSFQGDYSPALDNQWGGGSASFFNYSGTGENRSEYSFILCNPRQTTPKTIESVSGAYVSNGVRYSSSGSGQNISSSSFDGLCYIQNGGSNATTTVDIWAICD